jgi:hypothetical protein
MAINISRNIGENALLNKHTIKALPIIDSTNPKHIEEIAGNQLRVLKSYAPAFDFIVNIINKVLATGKAERYITDGKDYYTLHIGESVWKGYFSHCGDHTIRQSLQREVMKDLQTGWVLLHGADKRGSYIEERAPFRIMALKRYENGRLYREIMFSKAVFGSLVEGECFETGGGGYIEIPANFYAILTDTDKGDLQSYNPIYKLNVYALMKNTHKNEEIEVSRKELLQTIVPEYIDKDGNLKISAATIHDSLVKSVKESNQKIPSGMIVSEFYIGHGENSTIYFRENNKFRKK